jgi:stage IV sporulation protein A
VPVVPINCLNLIEEDINLLFQEILYEFPVKEVNIKLPTWVEELDAEHWLREEFNQAIRDNIESVFKVRDIDNVINGFNDLDIVEIAQLTDMNLGTGHALIDVACPDELYNQVLSEICGQDVSSQADMIRIMKDFSAAKKEYDKMADALEQVKETGYGMVPPLLEEMILDEPEIVRQGGRFGVKLRASAPSMHMIRVNVNSEFCPRGGQ